MQPACNHPFEPGLFATIKYFNFYSVSIRLKWQPRGQHLFLQLTDNTLQRENRCPIPNFLHRGTAQIIFQFGMTSQNHRECATVFGVQSRNILPWETPSAN
jgi:hypothetical protein